MPNDTYDFVVIGSGAGGPVAANLARAGYTVAVLEAGEDCDNYNYRVPCFHPLASEDPVMCSDPQKLDPDLFIFGLPSYFKGSYPGYSRLIAYSKCRDFVANRGHYFGTDMLGEEPRLTDPEKHALIEFLKPF